MRIVLHYYCETREFLANAIAWKEWKLFLSDLNSFSDCNLRWTDGIRCVVVGALIRVVPQPSLLQISIDTRKPCSTPMTNH